METIKPDLLRTLLNLGPLIPLQYNDKKPVITEWSTKAITELNKIESFKPRRVGIRADRFLAIDLDVKHGVDGISTYTARYGDPPDTPTQHTPSGGLHLIFKKPPEIESFTTAGKLGTGIDTRCGSNGYIATGEGYTWGENGRGPGAPLAEPPPDLLAAIFQTMQKETKAPDKMDMRISITAAEDPTEAGNYWLRWAVERGTPGNRNQAGFELACQLRDSGLSKSEAAVYMRGYASRVPQVPDDRYTEHEAILSLNEAYKGTPREPAKIPGTRKRADMENEEETREGDNLKVTPPGRAKFIEGRFIVMGYDCTDTGNGQRFIALNGDQLRWVKAAGRWYIWDGKRWARDDNGEAERRAKETARSILLEAREETDKDHAKKLSSWAFQSQSRTRITNMLELAKSETGITVPIDSFDQAPFLLNFNNGTLDMKTGELKPHNPAEYITKLIPLDYDESAKCPTWIKFLNEIMDGNQAIISFIQRAMGYTLAGDASEQILLILHGLGANGKSVLMETLLNAVGPDYASNTEIKTLLSRDLKGGATNELARLRGQRLVTVNEMPGRGKLDESRIKELTGGDTITARFLYAEYFSFKPTCTFWIRTNHKPDTHGQDYGLWRRICLVPFSVTIPPEKQDTKLQKKLEAEWPGIIRWAVMGCLAWLDEGLRMPDEVKAATKEYQHEQDTMAPFIEDRCIIDQTASSPVSTLYAVYKAWAETSGEKTLTLNRFSRELSERGFKKGRPHLPTGGAGPTTFFGIRIKDTE